MEGGFFIVMGFLCFTIVLLMLLSTKISKLLKTKDSIVYLAFIAVSLLLLLFTNPNREQHITEIKVKLLSKSMENQDEESISYLGLTMKEKALDMVVENHLSYSNYLIFSVLKLNNKEDNKIISVGLLGNIFTMDMRKKFDY